jgi:hypothetical protein
MLVAPPQRFEPETVQRPVSRPLYEIQQQSKPSEVEGQAKFVSLSKDEDFRSTLEKIEEQLAMSRKMFPS